MRLKYQTYEFGKSDIHVRTLRNRQEFHDPQLKADALGIGSANWSLFGVVWDSATVLAQMMWRRNNTNERILEVGCGIGLASLALAMRKQNIWATDRHPDAQEFLNFNADLNGLAPVPFERCSWDEPGSALGYFDLIIGSDLLYERSNLTMLAQFIEAHSAPTSEVLIIDPGRGLQAPFSKHMVALGYSSEDRISAGNLPTDDCPADYKGSVQTFRRHSGSTPVVDQGA